MCDYPLIYLYHVPWFFFTKASTIESLFKNLLGEPLLCEVIFIEASSKREITCDYVRRRISRSCTTRQGSKAASFLSARSEEWAVVMPMYSLWTCGFLFYFSILSNLCSIKLSPWLSSFNGFLSFFLLYCAFFIFVFLICFFLYRLLYLINLTRARGNIKFADCASWSISQAVN